MKADLLDDLSTLTTVPRSNLDRLVHHSICCICHDVHEDDIDCVNLTSVDIGLGTLVILHTDDEIKYRFEPSQKMEESILQTLETGESPVVKKIEEALVNKITTAYKDIFR